MITMKGTNQNITQIYDKLVYQNRSPKGWSIVIMPDKILIDNYHHGYPHIHPDRKEIRTNNQKETFNIVINHIHKNKGINYNELRKELIK
jgi:hypothetical protein